MELLWEKMSPDIYSWFYFSKDEILDFRKIYMRGIPNTGPLQIVKNLESILRNEKGKDQEDIYQLERSFSLFQEEPLGLQVLDFDIKFEQSLFKSKYEIYLKEIVVDHKKSQTYLLKYLWKYLQKTAKTEVKKQIIQNTQPHIHVQHPPRIMPARFSPLALPVVLHDLPRDYAQRINFI